MGQTSVWRGLPRLTESVFEILPAGGPTGIARQKTEYENSQKEEDDRVNGDLEGEHGDRPSSVTATASYGA